MPDIVFDAIRWPVMPDELDPKTKAYLQEMQLAIERLLTGSFNVSGDLAIGGYVYLMGPDRIRTPAV